jgi:hypothetical protein
MKAYRVFLTIDDSKQVVILDVPFEAGQVVEVVLLAQEGDRTLTAARLEALLKATQALPQAQAITEDDIAAEIEAYRSGQ